jgi:hypothetical protein
MLHDADFFNNACLHKCAVQNCTPFQIFLKDDNSLGEECRLSGLGAIGLLEMMEVIASDEGDTTVTG